MHVRDVDVVDEVLIPRRASLHSNSAARLGAVLCQRSSLDVAQMRNRDDHVLIGVEVLRVELTCGRTDFCPSRISILVLEFDSLCLDDLHLLLDAAENLVAAGNELLKLIIFSLKFLPLQSGQLTEPHLDNCRRLGIGKFKAGDQLGLGLVNVG